MTATSSISDPTPVPWWVATSTEPTGCYYPMRYVVGDGICDDHANNKYCYFDFGDCCKKESNYDKCTECRCEVELGICPGFEVVGNGMCDEFANIEECLYDGGECDHLNNGGIWLVGK